MDENNDRRRKSRFEAALWIVMGLLAFLSKDNPQLVYPNVLYLFLALLASSLATSLAVRRAPNAAWLQALTLLAGYASIAGIQQWSGGSESSLWTLYLLPLFTAAILLKGRELAWTAVGACASNALPYIVARSDWNDSMAFELALKTGILSCAAAASWAFARSERAAEQRAARQRQVIGRLEESLQGAAAAREGDRGMVAIAAGSAGAIHDLATPLMVVRAYARLHVEQRGKDDPLTRDLERIDNAASFCQDLVSGLLAGGGGPTAPRRLTSVVESALALAEPILRSRDIAVDRIYPMETLSVAAPQNALERVVLNIVGNAAKAMPAGGRLRVRLSQETGSAVLTIDDDGPGIPADILPRLFKPFNSSRKGKGGNGLGLYVSREAVKRAGGTLDAGNRVEGGARFTMRLPLAEPAVKRV